MQTIKIRRPKESFNQTIKYKILVDGEIVGLIKNGEEKILTIKDDGKTLSAKILSGRSNKIELKNFSKDQSIQIYGNSFMNKYLKYYGLIFPILGLSFILSHDYELLKLIGKIFFGIALLIAVSILIFMNQKWLILKT